MIERLQFISQENDQVSHLQSIVNACEAGVKWVQLRVKNKAEDEVLQLAVEARKICSSYGAKLIINDRPEIAKEVKAEGVHLGKLDMPVIDARKIVGNMIIGATANTFEDIQAHARSGADYIGLGPYRFTATKKNLSPILGLQGYADIWAKCCGESIDVPIVAIGGIEVADIAGLMRAGLHGIAVSSLIAGAAQPKEMVEKIVRELEENNGTYA